jgi:DNA-binding transcriptional ArsR family regulator
MFQFWLKCWCFFFGYNKRMSALLNPSNVAALIGEPTRTAILMNLLDGRARTAGELAASAEVSPQVASNHLTKLLEGDLLRLESQGRHRYYRLASLEVAQALEALAAIGQPSQAISLQVPTQLQFARSCYDHLAGRLAVILTEKFLEKSILVEKPSDYEVTPLGQEWFADFGIDVSTLKTARRSFARRCLDWSERRPHVAGALGAALFIQLKGLGWVIQEEERAVRLTVKGRAGLERELEIKLEKRY